MHAYDPITKEPRYFVEKKDGKGQRPTHVGDVRKNSWVPGVTDVLKTLAKPSLLNWLIKNAVHAVVTSPDVPGEAIDQKIVRVLEIEKQQEGEKDAAADMGTDIHEAIQQALTGHGGCPKHLEPYVDAALDALKPLGRCAWTEKVIIGEGFGGRSDAGFENEMITVVDFKGCNRIPDKPYLEQRLQVAAYCGGLGNTGDKRIQGALLHINRNVPGEVKLTISEDWQKDFQAFLALLQFYKIVNNL